MKKIYLNVFLSAILLILVFSCNHGKPTNNKPKQNDKPVPTVPELNNLKATDFMGTLPIDVDHNVINSDVTWDAFADATHYEVFIDDERTNDVEEDGKLTNTKFRTAEGLVDLDDKMQDVEKPIKITVKALNNGDEVIAASSITKTLPKKAKIKNITFNDQPYTENMKVKNPLTIKVAFNNKIRFTGDNDKLHEYIRTKLVIQQGTNLVYSEYTYDESTATVTIIPEGGLNEKNDYDFIVPKTLCDIFGMSYEIKGKTYSFKVEKSTEPAPTPDVLKVLINDDSGLDIKNAEKTNINVDSTVSIYFNQLIDTTTYKPATQGESGIKGFGVYITDKATGKGTDDSRLTDARFQTITEAGKHITKATFKMVGKLNFNSTEPLKGNTAYYIVIDEDLKTIADKKFNEKRFKFQTSDEKPVLFKLEIGGGIIVGNTNEPKNVKRLKKGDKVTIQAVVPQGKSFVCWDVGTYTSLTEEQKKSNPMEYTMIGEDVYIWATFK